MTHLFCFRRAKLDILLTYFPLKVILALSMKLIRGSECVRDRVYSARSCITFRKQEYFIRLRKYSKRNTVCLPNGAFLDIVLAAESAVRGLKKYFLRLTAAVLIIVWFIFREKCVMGKVYLKQTLTTERDRAFNEVK